MIPPAGFKSEVYPLRHQFGYAAALSAGTGSVNSTILTLVRNYKGATNPDTTKVNPHHDDFDGTETGAICAPMSIIDKLKLTLKFTLTEASDASGIDSLSAWWLPIFFSFPEKLDAADDQSASTVASLLELVKDATQEDVTPLFNNSKLNVGGGSDKLHPFSIINLTETFGIMNMDTDATMEAVTFDQKEFYKALRYYTNKGALKACIGKKRNFVLTSTNKRYITYHIDKFVPRAVRRIMPYSYFGILCHLPLNSDIEQHYWSGAIGATEANLGISCTVAYHEWNAEHNQDVSST